MQNLITFYANISIFILICIQNVNALIMTTSCSSITLSNCNASGYCQLSTDQTTCLQMDCYKINEITACRDSTAIAYNAATCTALSTLDIRYDNVCSAGGIIKYAQVRLPIENQNSAIYSTTGMQVSAISAETNVAKRNQYITQLLSLNLQTASNTQLIAILSCYVSYQNDMIGNTGYPAIHPYYFEKAIVYSLQNLRDDIDASKDQTSTLTQIWLINDILQIRLRSWKKYYSSGYFFINFAHSITNRNYLSIKAQYSVFSIVWTKITDNGYVQLTTYSPGMFSSLPTTAVSDVIAINIIKTSGATLSIDYTLTWLVTDLTKITCTLSSTAILNVISNRNTLTLSGSSINISGYCSDSASTKRCDIPSTVISAGQGYFITC